MLKFRRWILYLYQKCVKSVQNERAISLLREDHYSGLIFTNLLKQHKVLSLSIYETSMRKIV